MLRAAYTMVRFGLGILQKGDRKMWVSSEAEELDTVRPYHKMMGCSRQERGQALFCCVSNGNRQPWHL